MKKNKYIIGFIILFITFFVWYLFIKKSDYIISFKVKAATGTVFQGIQEWAIADAKLQNNTYKLIDKINFSSIEQEISNESESINYSWEINSVNDSITKVSVAINEKNESIYNRLTAPFFNTTFKQQEINKIKSFKEAINQHLKNLKVKINGVGISEETFVAYISLKSAQQEKAQTMIMSDGKITGFLLKNKIKIIGKPYLEVTKWDDIAEKVEFNYCFPIDKNTTVIQDSLVKFKTLPALKGLKATYHGNYRTSDRAWFSLLDYAKNHDYELNKKPLEHYFANPFNGGDELKWETIIIIPFKKQ